jgi:hypothetical protein
LNSDRMPMFEYIAKNVGIRRAKGEFILATNPDILYSAELTRFLASRRLCTSRFYRIDRHDVAEPVPSGLPPAEQLKFCAKHVFRANTITGTVRLPSLPRRMLRLLVSALRYPRRLLAGAERHEAPRHGLHTNAAGDFFLMAREHWYEVRGYPEFTSHAFIDGYACHMAAALGLEQVLLETPLRIYHQEHDRSEHRRRPLTDYKQYLAHGKKMLQDGRPETFNREDWGLASEQLEERWVRP